MVPVRISPTPGATLICKGQFTEPRLWTEESTTKPSFEVKGAGVVQPLKPLPATKVAEELVKDEATMQLLTFPTTDVEVTADSPSKVTPWPARIVTVDVRP